MTGIINFDKSLCVLLKLKKNNMQLQKEKI